MHVPLVTNSVHITPLSDLFCRYGTFWRLILYTYFSMFDLFSISTRSFWPSLYSSDIYGLYCLFSSPRLAYLYICYSDMCTNLCWPILYTYLLYVIFSIHKEVLRVLFSLAYFVFSFWCFILYTELVMFDLFCISNTTLHDLFFTLVSFMAYFVYLLLLGKLMFTWMILFGYMCTYLWWPIL